MYFPCMPYSSSSMSAMLRFRTGQKSGLALAISFFTLLSLTATFLIYPHRPLALSRLTTALSSSTERTVHSESSLDTVLNETLGFQKIIVINLNRQTDRRDQATLAASLLGLKIEYIDGVTDFDLKAVPVRPEDLVYQGPQGGGFQNKTYNSWRAHVNAIKLIVEQKLASALIMEDDADFDIRIKSQMQNFARASRLLLQPIQGTVDVSLDHTNPRKSSEDRPHNIRLDSPMHPVQEPTTSPYGDLKRWDLFWLGHCGTNPAEPDAPEHPLGRVVMHDPSAIRPHHLYQGYGDTQIWPSYPNNTRLVFHARGPACNLAYGISLPGAKRLLYQVGIQNMTGTTDTILRYICDGDGPQGLKYKRRTCLSVMPNLFGHHFPRAYPHPFTENIRYATRGNFASLIDDSTDYVDAFPDEEPMALYFNRQEQYERFLEDPQGAREQREDQRGY